MNPPSDPNGPPLQGQWFPQWTYPGQPLPGHHPAHTRPAPGLPAAPSPTAQAATPSMSAGAPTTSVSQPDPATGSTIAPSPVQVAQGSTSTSTAPSAPSSSQQPGPPYNHVPLHAPPHMAYYPPGPSHFYQGPASYHGHGYSAFPSYAPTSFQPPTPPPSHSASTSQPATPYHSFGQNTSLPYPFPSQNQPTANFVPHQPPQVVQPPTTSSQPFAGVEQIITNANAPTLTTAQTRNLHMSNIGPIRTTRPPPRRGAYQRPTMSSGRSRCQAAMAPMVDPSPMLPPEQAWAVPPQPVSNPVNIVVRVLVQDEDDRENNREFILKRRRNHDEHLRLQYYGAEAPLTLVPESNSVTSLVQSTVSYLAQGPYPMHFTAPVSTTVASSSSAPPPVALPLMLLKAYSKGKEIRKKGSHDTYIRLEVADVAPTTSVSSLIAPNSPFMLPAQHTKRDNTYYFFMTPAIWDSARKLMPGRNGRDPRFHTCISRRLRHLLRTDEHCEASAASRAAAELTFEHDDPVLCFSDDSDSEDRHDDQENQPPAASAPFASPVGPSPSPSPSSSVIELSDDDVRPVLSQPSAGLLPTTPAPALSLSHMPSSSTIGGWLAEVDDAMHDADFVISDEVRFLPAPYEIRAASMEGLIAQLEEAALDSARRQDCWKLGRTNSAILTDADDVMVSSGKGVLISVITKLFEKRLENALRWWDPRGNDYMAIAVGSSTLAPNPRRLEEMEALGILIAFHIIKLGTAPPPYTPFHFQWWLNDRRIRYISDAFIRTHNPLFSDYLGSWRIAGPSVPIRGNLANLLSQYSDIPAAARYPRTAAEHRAAEQEFALHQCTRSPNNLELVRSERGLLFPCSNGFNLKEAVHSFHLGTDIFISKVWVSSISSGDDVIKHTTFYNDQPTPSTVPAPYRLLNLSDYIIRFLKTIGSESPDAAAHHIATGRLKATTPDDLKQPGYRPRAFYEAVTGASRILPESPIKVFFAGPDSEAYEANAEMREKYMTEGSVKIRACFRTVHIPLNTLLNHLHHSYTDDATQPTLPTTAFAAIDLWLLREFLFNMDGFGDH